VISEFFQRNFFPKLGRRGKRVFGGGGMFEQGGVEDFGGLNFSERLGPVFRAGVFMSKINLLFLFYCGCLVGSNVSRSLCDAIGCNVRCVQRLDGSVVGKA
jgi:hypothetical protein